MLLELVITTMARWGIVMLGRWDIVATQCQMCCNSHLQPDLDLPQETLTIPILKSTPALIQVVAANHAPFFAHGIGQDWA